MIVELCLTSCCTPTKCCAHFSTPIAAEHSSSNSFLRKPGIVQSLTEEITSPKQSRYSFSAHRRSPSIPLEKRFVIYDIKIDVKIVLKSIDLSVLELLHTNTRMSTQFERHAGLFRAGRWGGCETFFGPFQFRNLAYRRKKKLTIFPLPIVINIVSCHLPGVRHSAVRANLYPPAIFFFVLSSTGRIETSNNLEIVT